jgi:hypothetical protein
MHAFLSSLNVTLPCNSMPLSDTLESIGQRFSFDGAKP